MFLNNWTYVTMTIQKSTLWYDKKVTHTGAETPGENLRYMFK